ncbi:Mitochondrial carrier protein MTM1 [Dichanthelium oligosanthes]|uniref:Mitochondrial carrier protein MTM1 n=1 Tax=Dichanthelium oligosanthes TaxID=888268 RepID=A0A1E5V100_9POAL|nr:Mitochondrial carrier protein MTM1 [Dichanthelium oligosanthes]
MVGCSRGSLPTWMTAAASRVDLTGGAVSPSHQGSSSPSPSSGPASAAGADQELGMLERALSAAGAAFISAIIVNPLDVAKTRLQAQAAGVLYHHPPQMAALGPEAILSEFRCSPSCTRGLILGSEPVCPPDCFQYKGTLDVFLKVVRQVGIYLPCYDIFRNWIEDFTSSNAPGLTPYAPLVAGSVARSLACIACSPIELARTRMQAYKEFRPGVKPPGMWKTLVGVLSPLASSSQNVQNYRVLWTGVGAQLARDVPFSGICWSTLEPIRRKLLGLVGEEGNAASVLGANFAAGFVAGSLAAGATCPLDVAKTRRQIEKDTEKAMRMTTRQTLTEIWRSGGVKGLFTGVGPRVARAGPSVGIVISFYEVVKYALHQRNAS